MLVEITAVLFLCSFVCYQLLRLCIHAIDVYEPPEGIKNNLFGPYEGVTIFQIAKHCFYTDIVFFLLIPCLYILQAAAGTFGALFGFKTVLFVIVILLCDIGAGIKYLFKKAFGRKEQVAEIPEKNPELEAS